MFIQKLSKLIKTSKVKSTTMQPEFELSQIKLIVGLGNPGLEYAKTRHNVGFMFLDSLNLNFSEEKKVRAEVAQIGVGEDRIFIIKPLTFMNNSGESVHLMKSFYKLSPQQILVIHDDLDIELGQYKLQFNKGPKVHNGILSIENHLSTAEFWRLRIGIDNRDSVLRANISGSDYVLGRFTTEELETLNRTFTEIVNIVLPAKL